MRGTLLGIVAVCTAILFAAPVTAVPTPPNRATYSVLVAPGTPAEVVRPALEGAGARVERYNAAVGLATVGATPPVLEAVTDLDAVEGIARTRVIGTAPGRRAHPRDLVEQAGRGSVPVGGRGSVQAGTDRSATTPSAEDGEPLQRLLWGHRRINATAQGSYAVERGDERVLVGVMDTGVDASHPDVAPNLDAERSRTFTTDLPDIDGPCEEEPDRSCDDPVGVDEEGHGTHVAGTIAAAMNGIGISGIAPEVTLVDLRAGQDSGYFFLQSVVDALVHAADVGVDVVNMSFYIDPWLFNCVDNPADPPAAQAEQRTVIEATQRALDYAHDHDVTLIAALGNGSTDLGDPEVDATSPNYPPDAARERQVDNSCLNLPTEGEHVIAISAIGPSDRKGYYSDYGTEQTDAAAPGGDLYDPTFGAGDVRNLILSAYPEALAVARAEVDPATGESLAPHVVADCGTGDCAYYRYLQGTSMAAPHAAGVAALIVSAHGRDADDRGPAMDPEAVAEVLYAAAADTACPDATMAELYPVLVGEMGREEVADDVCEGSVEHNGWYGHGVLDAAEAVAEATALGDPDGGR